MKILHPFIPIGFLMISLAAVADSIISVNALNYPAWIERNQQLIPLAPGSELHDGDIIKTGQSGRVWLSMWDGSVVKLGQGAEFKITSVEYEKENYNEVLKATLNVIKGAFRFTTSFFKPKRKSAHQVNIKIGAITAGLRGTDIWGRSTEVEDFVTLLEGSIMVEAEGTASAVLSEPLTLYLKKRGQAPEPLSLVEATSLQKLGQETELSAGEGIASIAGEYELVLMSGQNPDGIQRALRRFQQQGYAVQTMPVEINGEQYTRLVLQGFVSPQAASALSYRLKQDFNLQDVWMRKRSF